MRWSLIVGVLLTAGCTCPTFDGEDGELTYRSCTRPDGLVQRSSEWPVTVEEVEEGAPVTWTSDDAATVSATGTTEEAVLRAWEVGTATVTTTLADGTTDGVAWEVTRADSGTLVDEVAVFIAEGLAGENAADFSGELPAEPVPDVVRLATGQTIAFRVDLQTQAGDPVQWTPTALSGDGSVRIDDDEAFARLATSEVGHVLDDAGEALLEVAVVPIDSIGSGDLALGAYTPARSEPDADATQVTLAYLQAAVTDGGDRIWQPPVTWEVVTGPGTVTDFRTAGYGATLARTDLAQLVLTEDEVGRWETATVCVAATVESGGGLVSRSAWITADGVEHYDNGVCGNRGCSCSTGAPSRQGGALALLATTALAMRRRRSG